MIRILDRFYLGKIFKKCGHSVIYEAVDLRIQKSCLCKVYDYGKLPPQEAIVLHREISLLKKLRHPLLIRYLSVLHDHAEQRYLMFMEHIRQETLTQYIRRRRSLERGSHLSERSIWYIIAQFVDLLSYLHNSKFDHDQALLYTLIPDSIFINSLDIITVSFLSLSRKLTYHKCFSTHAAIYSAPELLKTGIATTKSDLWTLGCILYELCTFKPFCLAINSMDAIQKLGKLQRKVHISRYSNSLVSVINILLELEPERRMEAEVLAVNGIIREMIQSYKALLGLYEEECKEVQKANEQNEITTSGRISPHICSIQTDNDSSINLLCTQASIDSYNSSEVSASSLNPTLNVKEHHMVRYGDVLLLDFDMKRGCSILDDSLLANKKQHLYPADDKRRKKHSSNHPVSATQNIVPTLNKDGDQHCTSIYDYRTPFVPRSSIVVTSDGDQDITDNTKMNEQNGDSIRVMSAARRNYLDTTVYSVKTPYITQYTDNSIINE